MAEMTEHHPGSVARPHPADVLKEMIPRQIWAALLDAFNIGNKEHEGDIEIYWDKDFSYYGKAAMRHSKKLAGGKAWDSDDGQHHGASVAIRGLQMIGKDLIGGTCAGDK